jgi:hypothetical protein
MDKRKTKRTEPNLGSEGGGGELWGVDPLDVRRHARRMREARAVKPLGRFFRIGAIVLLLAGAVAIYWNRDSLQYLRFDLSRVTALFAGDEAQNAEGDGELGSEVVEDSTIAGAVSLPSAIGGAPSEADAPAVAVPAEESIAGEPVPTQAAPAQAAPAQGAPPPAASAADNEAPPAAAPAAAPAAPPPAPVVEEPVGPEMFGFGLERMQVSEGSASAAVLVLRDGGRRGESFITWWTTDGTATAGSDFARLEPRVERFGVGEQNRTLFVPIVGDRNVEGPENFDVHIAVGDSGRAVDEVARIEVVITDDD